MAEFRQFKKEIRGSAEHLLVGIDVDKDKHHAFFGTATGKTLFKRLVFENNVEGFRKLLAQAEAMKVQEGLKKVVFGMEPTGNYHKPLGEHLIRCGHGVVLVSGVAAHENRKTLDGRWDTNDTRDAANVADLVSQGKCLFYEFPVGAIQDLRNLLSLKRRLKRQEHGYRVRIRNHLVAKYFPELDGYFEQSEKTSLAIVRWCLCWDESRVRWITPDPSWVWTCPSALTLFGVVSKGRRKKKGPGLGSLSGSCGSWRTIPWSGFGSRSRKLFGSRPIVGMQSCSFWLLASRGEPRLSCWMAANTSA